MSAKQNAKGKQQPEKIIEQDARVQVSRTLQIGRDREVIDEKDEEQVLEVHRFVTEPARVEVRKGLTMSMGNYQFARFDIGVTLPCYAEEVPDAVRVADEFVQKKMAQEADDIRQFFQKPNKHQ